MNKSLFILAALLPLCSASVPAQETQPPAGILLGSQHSRFTLNGTPTFLYGISYYGALGASEESIHRDLAEMKRHGINWLRVWATWAAFSNDVSAVDIEGRPCEPFLKKLQWLVAECDRQNLVVDVTLSRGNGVTGPPKLQTHADHRRAVETIVAALKPWRNWYLDLSNERNIKDQRFTSFKELGELRELARTLDPRQLVTASHTGDMSVDDVREYLFTVRVDFLSPHRPRDASAARQTKEKSEQYLATMKQLGRIVPLHYQEPLRIGWAKWQPKAEDFVTDLQGARAGGAAGWCFHNGDNRAAPDGQPRRSFDLRDRRLFEQLDAEETKALTRLLQQEQQSKPAPGPTPARP